MKKQPSHDFKRLTWRKVIGITVAVVATIAVVIGVYSTSMWAGTGYDYQGNEVARALPVTKGSSQGGSDTSDSSQSKGSTARVFVKDNVGEQTTTVQPKLEHLNTEGGAVNVVQNPSYPQTGDQVNYGAVLLGFALLLGLAFIYRKSLTTLCKNNLSIIREKY
ncbi:LPXTG cell wall anchor domain-containing protein [Bombilactobacillus thymidiniphilus]|uniref:LPXTG cell wall anchor domain-containing protein n=1 Tax=Bombilactobacillus thymidiniphilus TaxID=2923363 RepID=A0ABY4PBR6_9LACO|nr:LPXTG cell wall anchor domain-containing protein [Bombilactobacillus thymidiniphilus]UQS83208.1 LPXTG cell wall anchor domain-containing protein [Bombilactobacillus thymidiniphilus]